MRINENVYVRGNGIRLPSTLSVADAIASGECEPKLVARTDVVSVAVSPEESAAEMAVAAAATALERAGSTAAEVDLILHADTYHQGQDLWPVASYIQRETVRNGCLALEIRQMSNGGMAALDLAVSYLTSRHGRADALLTTADRFCLPGIDRWRTDPGTPYADGATAIVLSRRGGYAQLLSLAVHADSDLEPLHRGDEPFGPAPFTYRMPVDFEAAKHTFSRQYGLSYGINKANAGQNVAIEEALADADMKMGDADWVVLPHFGRRRLDVNYLRPYDIDTSRTTWEWSRTVGHLGAGDQFAGLGHLVDTGQAKPGQRVVLVGVGAGYSWGCAVLEITEKPSWVD
ncbi:ketoacyl-ACP synthase III family protein [Nocardia sp. NRRL S-836]|uniref:ketoacyl-ACP synthase III family protein n=1 Tax=Nocardia sp. NRRL S-836 TaxID=1519492 RepID=UPI0006AE2881|nr:ketoacyl-ACP synthase III family protein [Nocardia sp. NRRL S-836]